MGINYKNNLIPIHIACNNCNIQQLDENIEESILSVHFKNDCGLTPLEISINNFFSTNKNNGDITPKNFDNPYVQIIIKLINNGAIITGNLLHNILFGNTPIFTMDDFFLVTTDIENKFPLHNSLELCNLCKLNKNDYDCYKKEYLYLESKFKNFSQNILDECRNLKEGKNIILLTRNGKSCIDLALEFEDKEFISNKYVQTEYEEKWVGALEKNTIYSQLFYAFLPCFYGDLKIYDIPCIKFYMHTIFNIIFLLLLYIQTYTITEIIPTSTEIIILIWIVGYIIAEIYQFLAIQSKEYFSDKWNYFDLIVLSLFIIVLILRIFCLSLYNHTESPYLLILSEHIFSFNIILSFLRILNVCQIHYILGPLILMLKKMFKDMIMFFCILSIFLGGFSLGITKIYHRLDNHEYNTISKTTMALFCALFGSFEIDNFKADNEEIEFVGIFILILYLILAVIILMNLFIAMLSNSYCIIQEYSDIEWKYSRVCLIITYSMYAPVPPPLNIIYRFYSYFNTNKQIEPVIYQIDYNDLQLQYTNNVLMRYYNKIEQKKKINIEDLNKKIDDMCLKINNLSSSLYEILDLSPINTKTYDA